MRLVFAVMVLVAHGAEFAAMRYPRDWMYHATYYKASDITLGGIAVNGFFLLSGYLIGRSWIENPEFLNFLRKRILRIVPGYLAAVLLTYIVMGFLVPPIPHSRYYLLHLPHSLSKFLAPPLSPSMPSPAANGSLWTIPYEFRCYLMVAILGLVGLLRKRWLCVILAVALLLGQDVPAIARHFDWHGSMLTGEGLNFFRFHAAFLVGTCFYLFRDSIPYRPVLAIIAAVLLAALFFTRFQLTAVDLFGAYLLFYAGQLPAKRKSRFGKFPDISYGVYLYGWPVQNLTEYYLVTRTIPMLLVSLPLTFVAGWLSWHWIERPALKWKRRPTAALPPP